MATKIYDPAKIEAKCNKAWEESGLYEVDIKKAKKPFYNLMMFPYPSAEGLHVGNMYAFTGADVYGRYQRMMGHDLLQPIGLDGFGIHSENYAIKVGRHPAEQVKISEENFYRQLKMIGNGFSWRNKLETYDPVYYRWTQWLFIQMFKKGLAYKKEAWVNWCLFDKTVLSDEQVINGCCERCGNEVVRKEISAWHFRITDYAEKLLSNIEKIRWPEKIKTAQRQWIGKKEGVRVRFELEGDRELEVFTTRLDTIFGVSFIVISPERLRTFIDGGLAVSEEVRGYVDKALNKTEQERKAGEKEKSGVKLDILAYNPVNGEKIPVFVADYVLSEVGTGAVMGVPAHDPRDWDFAKKHGLPARMVICPNYPEKECPVLTEAYVEEGWLVDSGKYDGLTSAEAKVQILRDMGDKASRQINYHLRDWVISRQRYWGPPIPMTKCETCGWQPVDEGELPVVLPEISDFKPKGDGTSPLANAPESWKKTKCAKCGGVAERELDVSDTFLDSAWYYLAYPHMNEGKWVEGEPFDKEILKTWLPVDAYIGGAEHAVLHLLYARFVNQALHDWGYLDFAEPFPFLFGHGLIIKDGAKMSKSKGNVVNPDEYVKRYGADALRAYLMFLGPYDQGGDFRDTGMQGMYRFLERVWKLVHSKAVTDLTSPAVDKKLQQTIKKVSTNLPTFSYNTSIAAIMELVNVIKQGDETGVISQADVLKLLQLLAPFAPFMTEELWVELGGEGSIHKSSWPTYEEVKDEIVSVPIQVNGKLRAVLEFEVDDSRDQEVVEKRARADERVRQWLGEKETKVIFVPGKMLNFVVS